MASTLTGLTTPLNLPAPGRRQCVYGALRGFARTCVFAKQSLGPIHCDRSARLSRGELHTPAPLLPKLRGQYAEFLDHVSLVHLRLLASPTCVGLRYGRFLDSPLGFSCPPTPLPLTVALRLGSRHQVSRIAPLRPYTVNPLRPRQLRSGVPRWFIIKEAGPESQPAVHRLRLCGLDLGSASPRADCHGAGTLRLTVSKVFTWICAYSFRHPHFSALHPTFPRELHRPENALLPRTQSVQAKLRRAA